MPVHSNGKLFNPVDHIIKEELFEVVTLAAAIDHEKIRAFFQRNQRVVPDIAAVIDALVSPAQKGGRLPRTAARRKAARSPSTCG